jgi:hypothetical protein
MHLHQLPGARTTPRHSHWLQATNYVIKQYVDLVRPLAEALRWLLPEAPPTARVSRARVGES